MGRFMELGALGLDPVSKHLAKQETGATQHGQRAQTTRIRKSTRLHLTPREAEAGPAALQCWDLKRNPGGGNTRTTLFMFPFGVKKLRDVTPRAFVPLLGLL